MSSSGLDIPVDDYETYFEEHHEKQSNALHSVMLPGRNPYLVGPLARFNLCFGQLLPAARREAEACKVQWPCHNNFKSIQARAVELIHAFEESLAIVKDYQCELTQCRVPFEPGPGTACHATEAPRGLLYHRYRIGEDGLIAEAKIVPPTSQNLGQIEARPACLHSQRGRPRRCRGDPAVRAPDPQLRPVHQLRDAFLQDQDRSDVTRAAPAAGNRRGTRG